MGKASRDKGGRFERELVNTAKAHGLDAYRAIAGQLSAAYRQTHKLPPWIILEIGYDQAADVTAIMATAGYRLFKKQLDYGDNDRCLVLTRDEDDGMT